MNSRTKNKGEETTSEAAEGFTLDSSYSFGDEPDEQEHGSEFDFKPFASKERMEVINRLDRELTSEYGEPFANSSRRRRQEILFFVTSEFENRFTQPMLLELLKAKSEFDYDWAGRQTMSLERMPVTASIDEIRKKMGNLHNKAEELENLKEYSFGIPRWSIGMIWGASILASLAVGSMLSSDQRVSNYYGEGYKDTMPRALAVEEFQPQYVGPGIDESSEIFTPAEK